METLFRLVADLINGSTSHPFTTTIAKAKSATKEDDPEYQVKATCRLSNVPNSAGSEAAKRGKGSQTLISITARELGANFWRLNSLTVGRWKHPKLAFLPLQCLGNTPSH